MAETIKNYRIKQKLSSGNTLVLHPETKASLVIPEDSYRLLGQTGFTLGSTFTNGVLNTGTSELGWTALIQQGTQAGNITLTLPNATGTIALTTDLPSISVTDGVFDLAYDAGAISVSPYTRITTTGDATNAGVSHSSNNGVFYTGTVNPALTGRLNYNGHFYATELYSGGSKVLTSSDIGSFSEIDLEYVLTNGALTTKGFSVVNSVSNPTTTYFAVSNAGAVDINGDLDVDNININGNTISSTNVNGNITFSPNGTGVVQLGVATATSINKVAITAPATGSTLTIANGKTLTDNVGLTVGAASTNTGAVTVRSAGTSATTITGPNNGEAVLSAGTMAITGGTLAQFAATTSSQLAGVISDETGSGNLVFATSPTLVTPVLGVATATSINKVAITAPANGSTLTIADGKTLTVNNTLTFTGTDASSVAFGAGGTVAYTGGTLGQFASTTSAQLAGVLSDETGFSAGALAVFNISPSFATSVVTSSTSFAVFNATATTINAFGAATTIDIGSTADTAVINLNSTKEATSSTVGGVVIDGGLAVAKKAYIGTDLIVGGDVTVDGGDILQTAKSGTNVAGSSLVISSGAGTGTGAVSSISFKTPTVGTTGTTVQTLSERMAINSTGTNITGDLTISGNLQVDGTTVTLNVEEKLLEDPIMTLGGTATLTADDNKDRGIAFRWHTGSAARTGFFGFDDSTGYFTFVPNATITNEVVSGTAGDLQAANFRGNLVGGSVTATTGTFTAANALKSQAAANQDAVIIAGRAGGTAGYAVTITPAELSANRTLTLADGNTTLQAGTMAITGGTLGQFAATTSAQLAGVISDETGSGVLVFGTSPTFTTSILTGSTTFALLNTTATTINAFGAATTIDIGSTSNTAVINLNTTKDASSSTVGGVVIDGGLSVAKKAYIGTELNVLGQSTLSGGVAIGESAQTWEIDGATDFVVSSVSGETITPRFTINSGTGAITTEAGAISNSSLDETTVVDDFGNPAFTTSTYTAVSVNRQGRVVAGRISIQVGESGGTNSPASNLVIGGLFFEEI
jgi:hypothetical protein